MNKTNVLHIISALEKKGPVQVLYDIVKYSDPDKFNFIIIALKNATDDSLLKKFELLPVKLIQLSGINTLDFYSFYKIIKKIIAEDDVQVIHSHCTRSLILNFLLKNLAKTIHSIQIYPGLQAIKMNGLINGAAINVITKYIIRRIDSPISCSKSVSELLQKKDDITTDFILNGSSPDVKGRSGKSLYELKEQLGLDNNSRYLISVGRLSPEKNFAYMINWFKQANLNSFKLLIIGNGPLDVELGKLANDNIIIAGFKSNFEEYLMVSDYYIATSLTEGMPLSVLIAMSQGLPLLLSDIPPHAEIFNLASDLTIGKLIDLQSNNFNIDDITEPAIYNEIRSNVIGIYNDFFTAERMAHSYNLRYSELAN